MSHDEREGENNDRQPHGEILVGTRASIEIVGVDRGGAMDAGERLQADYAGMGLTIGPHPMALRRSELALRGVLRAADLPRARDGRRVRVAGMVITRQRPGTAKGFVFLTLEDETGISNIIIRPDLYDRERTAVVRQPFLMIEGVLQHQDGVLSVRAERVEGIQGAASIDAHDFY